MKEIEADPSLIKRDILTKPKDIHTHTQTQRQTHRQQQQQQHNVYQREQLNVCVWYLFLMLS